MLWMLIRRASTAKKGQGKLIIDKTCKKFVLDLRYRAFTFYFRRLLIVQTDFCIKCHSLILQWSLWHVMKCNVFTIRLKFLLNRTYLILYVFAICMFEIFKTFSIGICRPIVVIVRNYHYLMNEDSNTVSKSIWYSFAL